MLLELRVETTAAYVPRSSGSQQEGAKGSQNFTYKIKDGGTVPWGPGGALVRVYDWFADWANSNLAQSSLLRSAATLVPIPRSTLPPPGPGPYHWPGREIATAFSSRGLGGQVAPLLERHVGLPRASTGGQRNAWTHRDSLRVVAGSLPPEEPVLLVDDVATTGSQLVGAAHTLLRVFPGLVAIDGYAAVRTTYPQDFVRVDDPKTRRVRVDVHTGSCSWYG